LFNVFIINFKNMQNYRTQEQYNELAENVINGNWQNAFKTGFEGGFYAQDLINFYDQDDNIQGLEFKDLIYLAEGIQSLR